MIYLATALHQKINSDYRSLDKLIVIVLEVAAHLVQWFSVAV